MTKKEIEEEIKRVEEQMKELKAECIKYVLNHAESIANEMLFPPDNGYDDYSFGEWADEMQELQEELEELEERLNEDEEDEEDEEEEEEDEE